MLKDLSCIACVTELTSLLDKLEIGLNNLLPVGAQIKWWFLMRYYILLNVQTIIINSDQSVG